MPKTTSTPTRSRASTRACAPVTRTGVDWCGRDAAAACGAAPGCCVAPGWARPAGCGVAGRGGAGLEAPVLAGMSSGEGACALEGAGLLCSVIGWLPCCVCARAVSSGGRSPFTPEGALKNPSCRVAAEGRPQELDWSALCAPAKYENVVPLHAYTVTHKPAPRQIITAAVSLSETTCQDISGSGCSRYGQRGARVRPRERPAWAYP